MPNQTRTGLITKKVGMTRVFDGAGRHVPVTVLQIQDSAVLATRTDATHGYNAVQVGAFTKKESRISKPLQGMFKKLNAKPVAKIAEFRVEAANVLAAGTELKADHFTPGQKVDVQGITKGRGFTGAMFRWNFSGLRATHGVSIRHRSAGSTGQRQDPGKVFKGKKMPGHYGTETVTTHNLEVVRVDATEGLILVKGSVPGAEGGYVMVRDAAKQKTPKSAK
jgi:large subunit ribosomal protein L3